jgi:hypothetical protein
LVAGGKHLGGDAPAVQRRAVVDEDCGGLALRGVEGDLHFDPPSGAADLHALVTFWGLNDRRSWRAEQSPLIFDRENQAKPALQAIVSIAIR